MAVLVEVHDNTDDPEVTNWGDEDVVVVNYQQAVASSSYAVTKMAELANSTLPPEEITRISETIKGYWE